MTLGYRGHSDWRDMSEYVVHFTTDQATLNKILTDKVVYAPSEQGIARGLYIAGAQNAACFSEIPLDLLDRLVQRRSAYGLGFTQRFLIDAGGGRVWYVEKDSPLDKHVNALRARAFQEPNTHPFWEIARFIDEPGDYHDTKYRFEWEREWRSGPLSFRPEDLAFVFMPEAEHSSFGLAGYTCPLIDPAWRDERLQAALTRL